MSMLSTHYCDRGENPQFIVLNRLMYQKPLKNMYQTPPKHKAIFEII